MRLFLAGVCSVLLAGPLPAAPIANVASASADGVRVRSQPALSGAIVGSLKLDDEVLVVGVSPAKATIDGRTAPWYRVLTLSGKLGWTFGGYLDAAAIAPGTLYLDEEGEPQLGVEDLGESFDGGELMHVWLDLAEAPDPSAWPILEVLFVRRPGGAAQVLFSELAGGIEYGTMERWLDAIETVDLVGDSRVEICATFSEGAVDSGGSEYRIFGPEPAGMRYSLLGTLPLGSVETGDVCGMTGNDVRSGPAPVVEHGQKMVKLVRETTTATFLGMTEDGSPHCLVETTVQEETYALKNGALYLAETKTVE